jgi:Tol biopolymer transport system component
MEIKFNCSNSACKQRISVDESLAGKPFSCPACGTSQQVPASKNVKFNCSNPQCEQHIVVDVSESGRYVKCPSCGKLTQVPGPPPRPYGAAPVTRMEGFPTLPTPKKKPKTIPPWMRVLYGWGMGAALFSLLIGGYYVRAWAILPKHLVAMSDEIFAEGRIWDAPVENNDGSMLLYAQDLQNGAGVFLVDLVTLKRTQIKWMETEEIEGKKAFRLFGWSPDDSYLAFASITTSTNQDKRKYQQIVICDGTSGAVKSSIDMPAKSPMIEPGVWLTTNTLVLLNHSHGLILFNLETNDEWGRMGKKGLVQGPRLDDHGTYDLVKVSERSVAYVDQGNVWNWDIQTGQRNQLTHFSNATIEWLDYNPATRKYLFCLTRSNDVSSRYVYEFETNIPGNREPVQRSDAYSLKGQWIQGNDGISYVTTTGDKTCLAIDSQDPSLRTNIFTGGNIRSYSVAPRGDKIYAVAALRYKAQSIWEYDITQKTFRDVLAVEQRATSSSKIILPVMASATNQSGEAVDYYYVPPANVIPNKKYPAVLDLYPVNRYDQNVQMLANAGIFYISANRFGLNDWHMVAKPESILTIYAQMLKNPNIDPKRIYICGRSFSSGVVTYMVNMHPELWHGALLFSPVAFPKIPANTVEYPSLFIAIGDEDDKQLQEQCQLLWQTASKRLVSAQMHIEHTGHGFGTQNYKTTYEVLTRFILTGY